jgi:hypothetical protein
VLCGTGAHGAYHAGVLRALQEAGVKIDVVAGQGVGAAGAMLAAIDGGSRLWESDGVWQSTQTQRFYTWTRHARILGLVLALFFVSVVVAVLTPAPVSTAATIAAALVLVGMVAILVDARRLRMRRAAGGAWWNVLGAPFDPHPAIDTFSQAVWQLIRGGAHDERPPREAGRRYAEVLNDNLGQPGFRELMIVATDLDARTDLTAALLREPYRHEFLAPRPGRERRGEALDLAGGGRDHALDIMAAALTPPVICEPRLVRFGADGYWRGESHRACERPGAVARLFEELAAAAVSQLIVVTGVATAPAPHRLRVPRLDVRSRLGEFVSAAEAAALRDALTHAELRFDSFYVIRPAHNPVGPFDFRGAYDEASDRRHSTGELMERGYEDAYHQFIEPVVGASGEMIAHGSRHTDRSRGIPDAH